MAQAGVAGVRFRMHGVPAKVRAKGKGFRKEKENAAQKPDGSVRRATPSVLDGLAIGPQGVTGSARPDLGLR